LFVIYLRSSSIGDFLSCEHKYFLNYTLGINLDSNQAAKKGVLIHKAMELLARKKIAIQNCQANFIEEDSQTTFDIKKLNTYSALEFALNYYKDYNLSDWDIKEIKKSYWDTIKEYDGYYNPLNRKIIDVEHFFNFTIDKKWGYYSYIIQDEPIIGNLCIRGTMDLLTEESPDVLHYIDWKTGSRKDWKNFVNGQAVVKTLDMIREDPQLQLYHYVIRKKFPKYKTVKMTLFFTKDGGPYTVEFSEKDVVKHEKFLIKIFEDIKNVKIPKLIKDDETKNPHCKFCQFNKFKMDNGKTYCSHYESEIQQIGLDKLTDSGINMKKHYQYEGGGANREL
jgi:CRISPR/Cas system-associated exonuclease Cas4 (RecB family)